MNFVVPEDHRGKNKENEARDNYTDHAMLRNMKVTVMPIVIGALETVPKRSVRGVEELKVHGRTDTI